MAKNHTQSDQGLHHSPLDAQNILKDSIDYDSLCWGLMTRQPLWVILSCLPEKGKKEIEEIVAEIKERDREERTGMKVKKQKK